MAHGHEPRIRELERRYEVMGNDLRTLRRQTTAVREGVRDYWRDGIGLSPSATPPCVTNVSGKVIGCLTGTPTALPGSSIHVIGFPSTFDYGTYSLSGGDFGLGLYLQAGDTSLNFTATGPSPRFGTSGTLSRSVTPCGSTTVANLAAPAASGYLCIGALCQFPVGSPLTLVDAVQGGGTITIRGGGWDMGAGTPYTLVSSGVQSSMLIVSGAGFNVNWGNPTSHTCPDAGSTKFDATWTYGGGGGAGPGYPYAVGSTIRIYEP